jgi:hypothetical protein
VITYFYNFYGGLSKINSLFIYLTTPIVKAPAPNTSVKRAHFLSHRYHLPVRLSLVSFHSVMCTHRKPAPLANMHNTIPADGIHPLPSLLFFRGFSTSSCPARSFLLSLCMDNSFSFVIGQPCLRHAIRPCFVRQYYINSGPIEAYFAKILKLKQNNT